ncbi:hypothetical protein [Sphingobium sp. Z007]|uniref:hypothetical protein n=1 Tax=Sphingobium sp. Z007 TaxID=627495 RepID=UPI0015963A6C|nr:hypothetical protein [Sphingobium sp. Z007]
MEHKFHNDTLVSIWNMIRHLPVQKKKHPKRHQALGMLLAEQRRSGQVGAAADPV